MTVPVRDAVDGGVTGDDRGRVRSATTGADDPGWHGSQSAACS